MARGRAEQPPCPCHSGHAGPRPGTVHLGPGDPSTHFQLCSDMGDGESSAAGLCKGQVARVENPWGKAGRGSGAHPGFSVVLSDHVVSGMGSQFQSDSLCQFVSSCAWRGLDPTSYLRWAPSFQHHSSSLSPTPTPTLFVPWLWPQSRTLASALHSEFRHLPCFTPCPCLNSPPCSICQGLHGPRTTCLSPTQSDKGEAGSTDLRGAGGVGRGEAGGVQGSGPGKVSSRGRGGSHADKTQCNKGVFRSPYHLSVRAPPRFPSAPARQRWGRA